MTKLASIVIEDTEACRVALGYELGNARGRRKVFPDARDLVGHAADAEKRLEKAGIAKSNRVGCVYRYTERGPSAGAYGYKKTVLSLTLKRVAKGWTVVYAGNTDVFPKYAGIDRIDLTPKAKEALIRHAMQGFGELPVKTETAVAA